MSCFVPLEQRIQSQSRLKGMPEIVPPACACVQPGCGRNTLGGVWDTGLEWAVFVCGGKGKGKREKNRKKEGKNERREKPEKKRS